MPSFDARFTVRASLLACILVPTGIVFSTGVAGCGDSSTNPEEEGLAFEQFTETYRQAQCQRAVTCGIMPDVDTCYVSLAQDLNIAQSVAAVAFGTVTYDPKAAQTCIDTLTNANCEGFDLLTEDILTVCDSVFGNRLGEGDDCVASAQCAGLRSICDGACGQGCCHGTCKGVAAAGAEGDVCSDLAPCGEGLRCLPDETGTMATCTTLAGPNQPCTPFGCISGYACGSGKCFQQAPSGASCNPALADSCASLNEYCHADQKTCVPLPRAGENCGVNPVGNTYCARSAACVDGKCVAFPSVGDECLGESACLGALPCSGDPDFVCLPLPNPDICVNFEGAAL